MLLEAIWSKAKGRAFFALLLLRDYPRISHFLCSFQLPLQ